MHGARSVAALSWSCSFAVHAAVIGAASGFALDAVAHGMPPAAIATVVAAADPRPAAAEIEPPKVVAESHAELRHLFADQVNATADASEDEPPTDAVVDDPLPLRDPAELPREQWLQPVLRRTRSPEPPPAADARAVVVAEPVSLAIAVVPGDNPPPAYPQLAIRRGLEGVVGIEVTVARAGGVDACRVAQSSGSLLLDAAALAAVWQWRFQNGPGTTRVVIEFALTAAGSTPGSQ